MSADFGSTNYAWDDMLDDYSTGQGSASQREAVALLVYQAGVAVNMLYGEDVSLAGFGAAADAFNDFFRMTAEYVWSSDTRASVTTR